MSTIVEVHRKRKIQELRNMADKLVVNQIDIYDEKVDKLVAELGSPDLTNLEGKTINRKSKLDDLDDIKIIKDLYKVKPIRQEYIYRNDPWKITFSYNLVELKDEIAKRKRDLAQLEADLKLQEADLKLQEEEPTTAKKSKK
jgi:hypothetical protein